MAVKGCFKNVMPRGDVEPFNLNPQLIVCDDQVRSNGDTKNH